MLMFKYHRDWMDSEWFSISHTNRAPFTFYWLAGRKSAKVLQVPKPSCVHAETFSSVNVFYNQFLYWLCCQLLDCFSKSWSLCSDWSDGSDSSQWMTDLRHKSDTDLSEPTRRRWLVKGVSFDFFREESDRLNHFFKSHAVILLRGIVCLELQMTDNLVVSVPPEHDTCTAESVWMEVSPPLRFPPLLSVSLSLAVVGHQSFVVETIVAAIKDARWKEVSILTSVHLSSPLSLCLFRPPVTSHPSPRGNNEQRQPPVFTVKEKLTANPTWIKSSKLHVVYCIWRIYKFTFVSNFK